MHTEDLVVDHNAEGEEVEHVGEVVPDVGVSVLPRALSVEPIRLGDTTRFVVAPDEMDTLRVSQLQTD